MPYRTLKDVQYWNHIGFDNKPVMTKPKDIPFFTYNNFKPCHEANMYVQKRSKNAIKATSLKTEAGYISHLIRFIEKQPTLISFSQLTNDTFTLFVQNLQNERKATGEKQRENNTVIEIAHRCLEFLKFVQEFYNLKNFIGSDKANSIQLIEKPYKIKIEGRRGFKEGIAISHSSVPSKNAQKKRHPVSSSDALRLWEYLKVQSVGKDKRTRDKAMYVVMEQLGARIKEFHLITLSDYEEARRTGMMRLTTLKRRDDKSYRHVKVGKMVLNFIAPYIKIRKRVMKKKNVKHDFLFISLTTGQPFSSDSWGTYINTWKKELGIKGELHAHLFRHAYITNRLKEIILTHTEINNKDDFRKHLLHTAQFKQELQQETGHTLLSSLDPYINLVFADINGYTETYNAVSLKNSVNLLKRALTDIKEMYKVKEISRVEYDLRLDEVLESFEADVDKSINDSAL